MKEEIENYLYICEKSKGLSKYTLKAYKIDFKQFKEFMFDKNYLSKNDLVAYVQLQHDRYKPKTAKRKIACIKAFYHYLEIENIIEYNPFHKILLKHKEPILLPKTIPLDYIYKILNFSYDFYNVSPSTYQKEIRLRNIAVIELLFSTGMRVSELSHLKTKDIDLSSGNIRILGKGAKERVMCVTNEDILNIIRKYISIRKENDYVFVNRQGERFSEQSIRNMINKYAKSAQIPLHITPHMFRHTFATELHNEDVDIQYIQQFLGHSSITTTQIYSHISTNKMKNILENKHPRNNIRFNCHQITF